MFMIVQWNRANISSIILHDSFHYFQSLKMLLSHIFRTRVNRLAPSLARMDIPNQNPFKQDVGKVSKSSDEHGMWQCERWNFI